MKLAKQIIAIYLIITGVLFNAQLIYTMFKLENNSVVQQKQNKVKQQKKATVVKKFNSSLTLANFNKIETGMNLEQVEKILGVKGIVQSSVDSDTLNITTYVFETNTPLPSIVVTFQNQSVTSKAQVGLK